MDPSALECEYLETNEEGTTPYCTHEKIKNKIWHIGMFQPKCVEHQFNFVKCTYKLTIWDILTDKYAPDTFPNPVENTKK
jgi:hypothetical protein